MRNKAIIFAVLYTTVILVAILIISTSFSNPTAAKGFTAFAKGPGLVAIILGGFVFLGLPPILLVWALTRTPEWEKDVQMNGTLAPALVRSLHSTGVHVGATLYYSATIQVQPESDLPFEARIEKPYQELMFAQPGNTITVKYDPNNKQHVILASVQNQLIKSDSLSGQLANLVEMHRRGDLSDTEFAAAKKKLLY